LSRKVVAEALLWSVTKLARIESSASSVSPADVRALAKMYRLTEARMAELVDMALAARRLQQLERVRAVLSKVALRLIAHERSASAIFIYQPTSIPTLLQTEGYARELLAATGSSDTDIETTVQLRLSRQELLGSDECPLLDCVIDEAAVCRLIGGSRTMRDQIGHLISLAANPKVRLRLITFDRGGYPGMGAAFTILRFDSPTSSDMVYLDSGDLEDIFRDNHVMVSHYSQRFEQLKKLAHRPEDTIELLASVRSRLHS
jgi:hypothetical protein